MKLEMMYVHCKSFETLDGRIKIFVIILKQKTDVKHKNKNVIKLLLVNGQ